MKSEGHTELAPPFAGLGEAGPDPHWILQQDSCSPNSGEMTPSLTMGKRELTLKTWSMGAGSAPGLRQVAPLAPTDQLSYHPSPQPGLVLVYPGIYHI